MLPDYNFIITRFLTFVNNFFQKMKKLNTAPQHLHIVEQKEGVRKWRMANGYAFRFRC